MVAHGRVELLAHPLSQKYLQMKWNSYGKYFHLANLLFYSIYLVFVTIYSYLLMTVAEPSTVFPKGSKCIDGNAVNTTGNASMNTTAEREVHTSQHKMMDSEASKFSDSY